MRVASISAVLPVLLLALTASAATAQTAAPTQPAQPAEDDGGDKGGTGRWMTTEYYAVPESWFIGRKVAASGLPGKYRVDWLYSARGVSMEGDGIGLDGQQYHIEDVGSGGWVNERGKPTTSANGWAAGPPLRLRQVWARISPANPASAAVARRAGFRRLGAAAGTEIWSRSPEGRPGAATLLP